MPLGDWLIRMPWRVEALEADYITVFCQPSRRFLFPRANEFIDTPERFGGKWAEQTKSQSQQARPHAEHVIFKLGAPEKKPHLQVVGDTDVDVCVAPRFKIDFPHRNWDYWPSLVGELVKDGLRVKSLGIRDNSYDCGLPHIHPIDEMAKAIKGAKLTIATDSAAAHLAILLGCPVMVIWGDQIGVIPGQTYSQGCHKTMERQKWGPVWHLPGAWGNFKLAVEGVRHKIKELTA